MRTLGIKEVERMREIGIEDAWIAENTTLLGIIKDKYDIIGAIESLDDMLAQGRYEKSRRGFRDFLRTSVLLFEFSPEGEIEIDDLDTLRDPEDVLDEYVYHGTCKKCGERSHWTPSQTTGRIVVRCRNCGYAIPVVSLDCDVKE